MSIESIIPIEPPDLDHRCGFCLDTPPESEGKKWAVHTGENGKNHPFHLICIKSMFLRKPECPMCKVGVDISSIITNSERFGAYLLRNEQSLQGMVSHAVSIAKAGSLIVALVLGEVGAESAVAGGMVGAVIGGSLGGEVGAIEGVGTGIHCGAALGVVLRVVNGGMGMWGSVTLLAIALPVNETIDFFINKAIHSIFDYALYQE